MATDAAGPRTAKTGSESANPRKYRSESAGTDAHDRSASTGPDADSTTGAAYSGVTTRA